MEYGVDCHAWIIVGGIQLLYRYVKILALICTVLDWRPKRDLSLWNRIGVNHHIITIYYKTKDYTHSNPKAALFKYTLAYFTMGNCNPLPFLTALVVAHCEIRESNANGISKIFHKCAICNLLNLRDCRFISILLYRVSMSQNLSKQFIPLFYI